MFYAVVGYSSSSLELSIVEEECSPTPVALAAFVPATGLALALLYAVPDAVFTKALYAVAVATGTNLFAKFID